MAHVLAFIPDLLFGSRVQADCSRAVTTVELIGDPSKTESLLQGASVLVVDLTDDDYGGISLMESLSARGLLVGVGTLAFYSHVDAEMRLRARDAGFDMVVARSRMAREGAALIGQLAGEGGDRQARA